MTSRRRPTQPVPLQPTHRRSWRTLWRRCTCGLAAPCVDRLVPARKRPYPPRPKAGAADGPHSRDGVGNADSLDVGRRHVVAHVEPSRRGYAGVPQAGRAGDLTPTKTHRTGLICYADGRSPDGTDGADDHPGYPGHAGYPGHPGHRQVQPGHR
jgi:hypothetical protein